MAVKKIKDSSGTEHVIDATLWNSCESPEAMGLLSGVKNITYSELVGLRDNSNLAPGQQYRITDYVTTTVQDNTQSAGHLFDIIVTALSNNTLAEEAYAMRSERDTDNYFGTSELNAWKLWYCLDNDSDRFAWEDINGTGVIYRMIDEYGNDCPYDFKNIQFYNENWDRCVYTFTWINGDDSVMDTSIFGNDGTLTYHSGIYGVTNNIIKPYYIAYIYDEENDAEYYWDKLKQYLNNIVFISDWEYQNRNHDGFRGCYSNSFGNNCNSNSFGNECSSNIFGNECSSNSFGNNCTYNSFGNNCNSNSFGNNCYSNSFGNNCYSNSFGNNCNYNSFGNNCNVSFSDYCSKNSFGNNCYYNSFGENCGSNSFGNECSSNSFDNGCSANSFGNYCYVNIFGNECRYNSFGNCCHHNHFNIGCYSNSFDNECYSNSFDNDCYNNSFGNDCYSNSFGLECTYNSFGENCGSNSFGDFCYNNSFGNNCHSNSFVSECSANSFGNVCSNNSFSDNCYDNSFGNDCGANSFGDHCDSNSFGNNCYSNSFGNNCNSNSFGNECSYIKFGTSSQEKNNYRYITVESGNKKIYLSCTGTTSTSKYFQNIHIGLGVNNTTTYKTIANSGVDQTYETKYVPADSQVLSVL